MGYEARCKPVDRRQCSKSGLISHSRVAAIWSYPIELTRHHFQSASKVRGSWRYSESPRYDLWPSVSNVAPRFTLARTKAWIEAAELFAITARRTRPDRVSRYFALIFRALAWLVVRSTTSTAPAIMIFPAFAASKNASSVRNGISV